MFQILPKASFRAGGAKKPIWMDGGRGCFWFMETMGVFVNGTKCYT